MSKSIVKQTLGMMTAAALLLTTAASIIPVSANSQVEYQPIAAYDFTDQNDPGKDSTGMHNLSVYTKDGNGISVKDTSKAKLVTKSNRKGIEFDDNYWLATTDNFTKDLKEMTISYWVKQNDAGTLQGAAIYTGCQNGSTTGIRLGHNASENHNIEIGITGKNTEGNTTEAWIGSKFDTVHGDTWTQYIFSIKLASEGLPASAKLYMFKEGEFTVGDISTVNLEGHVAELTNPNLGGITSLCNDTAPFALGAMLDGIAKQTDGAGFQHNWKMQGIMSGVRVYDKAFDDDQAKEFVANGKIMTTIDSSEATIDTGLIASYQFDDSQNPGKDSTGVNNLTVYKLDQDIAKEDPSKASLVDGPFSDTKAISFDDTYWMATDDNFTKNLTELTFTWWAKRTSDDKLQGTAIFTGAQNGQTAGIRLGYASDTKVLQIGLTGLKSDGTPVERWIGDGWGGATHGDEWTKYVFTLQLGSDNNGKAKLYMVKKGDFTSGDSQSVTLDPQTWDVSKLLTTLQNDTAPFALGATLASITKLTGESHPSTWKMSGLLSNVQVYNRVLKDDEIKELIATEKITTDGSGNDNPGDNGDNDEPDEETIFDRPVVTGKQLLPVARYDFSDAANLGKDIIGNHDLKIYGLDQKENSSLAKQTSGPWKDAKALDFDGNYYLAGSNFTKDMKQMTVTFWSKERSNGELQGVVVGTGCINAETAGVRIGHSGGTNHNVFFGYAGTDAEKNMLEVWGGDRGDFSQGQVWTRYIMVFQAAEGSNVGNCELYIIKNGDYTPGDIDSLFGVLHYENYQSPAWDPNLNAEKIAEFGNVTADFVLGAALGTDKTLLTGNYLETLVGQIADVRVYDWALSQDQAMELIATDTMEDLNAGPEDNPGDEPSKNPEDNPGSSEISSPTENNPSKTGDNNFVWFAMLFLVGGLVGVFITKRSVKRS